MAASSNFHLLSFLESWFLPISINPQVLSLSLDMVDPEDPKGRGGRGSIIPQGLNQRVVEGIKYQPINWLEFPSP